MKGKYITTQVLLACLSHRKPKDVHSELSQTIAERKRLLIQWQRLLLSWLSLHQKDIHAQLEETIAERKRLFQQLNRMAGRMGDGDFGINDKKAA